MWKDGEVEREVEKPKWFRTPFENAGRFFLHGSVSMLGSTIRTGRASTRATRSMYTLASRNNNAGMTNNAPPMHYAID